MNTIDIRVVSNGLEIDCINYYYREEILRWGKSKKWCTHASIDIATRVIIIETSRTLTRNDLDTVKAHILSVWNEEVELDLSVNWTLVRKAKE